MIHTVTPGSRDSPRQMRDKKVANPNVAERLAQLRIPDFARLHALENAKAARWKERNNRPPTVPKGFRLNNIPQPLQSSAGGIPSSDVTGKYKPVPQMSVPQTSTAPATTSYKPVPQTESSKPSQYSMNPRPTSAKIHSTFATYATYGSVTKHESKFVQELARVKRAACEGAAETVLAGPDQSLSRSPLVQHTNTSSTAQRSTVEPKERVDQGIEGKGCILGSIALREFFS